MLKNRGRMRKEGDRGIRKREERVRDGGKDKETDDAKKDES